MTHRVSRILTYETSVPKLVVRPTFFDLFGDITTTRKSRVLLINLTAEGQELFVFLLILGRDLVAPTCDPVGVILEVTVTAMTSTL
jgi:hypothetical protein